MNRKNGWFTEHFPENRDLSVIYFFAEYGLQHSLPFYARGLDFLAGDHLKDSSVLGLPLVAAGFMYS